MSSDNKINVFFNEYNLLMGSGGVMYLPFVSGILSANAKKINKKDLKKLILKLHRCGIQARPLWYPNHLQKPFLKYESDDINYLNNIYTNRLCLPSSSTLTVKQIKFVCSKIYKYISGI